MPQLSEIADGARLYTTRRPVRLGDAGADGRLHLPALAAYLQDVAHDEMCDAGLGDTIWVVRRNALLLEGRPRLHETVELTTTCTGLGSRWAERRTTAVGPDSRIESVSIWVNLDQAGRPARHEPRVLRVYEASAANRRPSSRLTLPPPPESGGESQPWMLRESDFDVQGRVNNAVYWNLAEDHPIERGWVEMEYVAPIDLDTDVRMRSSDDGHMRWLVSDSQVHAAVRLPDPTDAPR